MSFCSVFSFSFCSDICANSARIPFGFRNPHGFHMASTWLPFGFRSSFAQLSLDFRSGFTQLPLSFRSLGFFLEIYFFFKITYLFFRCTSISGSVRWSFCPTVHPSVGPLHLYFGGVDLLFSTAWSVLALLWCTGRQTKVKIYCTYFCSFFLHCVMSRVPIMRKEDLT